MNKAVSVPTSCPLPVYTLSTSCLFSLITVEEEQEEEESHPKWPSGQMDLPQKKRAQSENREKEFDLREQSGLDFFILNKLVIDSCINQSERLKSLL